jgi:hypothetical protein
MPVEHGRVQVLTRVPPADKDDLVRISNHTGFSQQDVMRMFLVWDACVLGKGASGSGTSKRHYGSDADNSQQSAAPDEVARLKTLSDNSLAELATQAFRHAFDPSVPPGVRKDD